MQVKLRDRRLAFVVNGETIAGPGWSPDFKWLDLSDLANGLKTRKWFVLSIALLASAFGLILALLLPAPYNATLLIPPAPQTETRTGASLGWGGGTSNLLLGATKKENAPPDLYIGLLNSRVVADAIIRRFDLQKVYDAEDGMGARENLAKKTEIKKAKDGSITISVEDRDKARAGSIANAYAEALQEFVKELLMIDASQRLSIYEAQLKEAKSDLLAAQVAVKQIGQSKGTRELLESNAKAEGFREEDDQKYAGAIREMRYRQALYEVCSKQYEEARLAEAEVQNATVIRVVEAAIPSRKSSARIEFFVLGSALCGLLIGSFIVVIGRWKKWMKADPARWAQFELLRQATTDK